MLLPTTAPQPPSPLSSKLKISLKMVSLGAQDPVVLPFGLALGAPLVT